MNEGDIVIAMTDMATETKILGVPTIVPADDRNWLLNQRVGKLTNIDGYFGLIVPLFSVETVPL